MKALICLLSVLFLSTSVLAYNFEEEMPEYDQKPYDNSAQAIQKRITERMKIACDEKGLCEIAGKDTHNRGWSVTVNAGEGSGGGQYGQGGGDTVIIGDANLANQQYYGISVKYENNRCSSVVKVDEDFYRAIKFYAASTMTETGEGIRTHYPTGQANILLYTTIMANVEGCRSGTSNTGR